MSVERRRASRAEEILTALDAQERLARIRARADAADPHRVEIRKRGGAG